MHSINASGSKRAAHTAYEKLLKDGVSHDDLAASVKNYVNSVNEDGTNWIYHMATFFSFKDRHYETYLASEDDKLTWMQKYKKEHGIEDW